MMGRMLLDISPRPDDEALPEAIAVDPDNPLAGTQSHPEDSAAVHRRLNLLFDGASSGVKLDALVAAGIVDGAGEKLLNPDGTPIASGPGGSGFPAPNERGAYAPGDYLPGDLFVFDGVILLTIAPFTGGASPDLTKVVTYGVAPAVVAEFDDSGLDVDGNGTAVIRDEAGAALLTFVGVVARTMLAGGSGAGTPADPPGQLLGFTATAGGSAGSVNLAWTALTGATAYQERHAPAGTTTWSAWSTLGAGTSATVTGLTEGASLEFQGRGLNSGGPGLPSATSAAVTVPATAAPGVLFAEDYSTLPDGPLSSAWTVEDPAAAPVVSGGILLGGGSGGQTIVRRSDVAGAHNATYTWRVPANKRINTIVRWAGNESFVQWIRVLDSVKLEIVDYPANPGRLISSTVPIPTHDYDVVLLVDGTVAQLYIDGAAGPAIADAPFGDSSHDAFGYDLRGPTEQIVSVVVAEPDA